MILLLMTSLRSIDSVGDVGTSGTVRVSSSESSESKPRARSTSSSSDEMLSSSWSEHTLRIASSISVIFAPTKGSDHVNASMKFGSQYGCDVALYCLW